MTRSEQQRRAGGFTLIELLVVIAVLAVLAVALLPNVLGAGVAGEVAETEARITYLVQAARAFERDTGYYPPDQFRDLELKVKADSVNQGIEVLVIALAGKRLGRDSLTDHEDWLGNTDADKAGVELPGLDRTEKMEVLDAWRTPLAYFCSANGGYERKERVMGPGGDTQPATVVVNPRTGKPMAPGKFQIVSAGPDGVFGNDDDVCYPARVVEE